MGWRAGEGGREARKEVRAGWIGGVERGEEGEGKGKGELIGAVVRLLRRFVASWMSVTCRDRV